MSAHTRGHLKTLTFRDLFTPFYVFLQALRNTDLCLETEQQLSFLGGTLATLHKVYITLLVDRLEVVGNQFFQIIENLPHAGSSARPYVEKITCNICFGGEHIRSSYIFNVSHVHGLGAIPENRDGLPIRHEVIPTGYDLRISALDMLAGAIHIEITEGCKCQFVFALEISAELFARNFRGSVYGLVVIRMAFIHGEIQWLSIDRTRGGENYFLDSMFRSGLQNIESTGDIGLNCLPRQDASFEQHNGGSMKNE